MVQSPAFKAGSPAAARLAEETALVPIRRQGVASVFLSQVEAE